MKTGLAFALVFGIALQAGWMSPYVAGWAVAVIALPTAGESIRKGGFRIVGTIFGCIAALVIHALAPQERWLFMFLTCSWVFMTTYLMVSKQKDSYLWVMACYVCLVILLSDLDSSADMFASAVFRTIETVMGVVVYTLISVFIWPQTNLGAIRKTSAELATILQEISNAGREIMLGQRTVMTKFQGLQSKALQQLAQFRKTLDAEGSESYEVSEVRNIWEEFDQLATAWLETTGRWQSGLAELAGIDLLLVAPKLQDFFAELDTRFAMLPQLLAGQSTDYLSRPVRLQVDAAALGQLSGFDRAAFEVARFELEQLEQLSAALLECAFRLHDPASSGSKVQPPLTPGASERGMWFPVPDYDHLRSAAFVTVTTGVGFIIWIYFDPPGHSGWFQVTGTMALLVAAVPSLRASKMITPVALTSLVCLGIYVFVMPQLSSFLGLGSLLFLCMFANFYFFSGMARFFCSMAILTILQIQNHQVYAFAMMANLILFLVLDFTFLFVMTYLLGSPRPEKVVLSFLDRFFHSAGFLMSRSRLGSSHTSWLERWRVAFHRRQLRSLPAKLATWSNAIDRSLFPDNTAEQVQGLVTSAQTLVYRLDQFLDADAVRQDEILGRELRDNIDLWHTSLEATFDKWARNPEAEPVAALRQRLEAGLLRLEHRIKEALNRAGSDVSQEEGENFFRLLGGYRGVSEAALAYAGAAQTINWSHWREERFS